METSFDENSLVKSLDA